ncbi:MAG: ATP-binding protein [Candidatus Hydrogenedentota bacterium]
MSQADYFQFIFPARYIYIRPIRLFISELSKSVGFDKADAHVIETLLDEACTNAIEHGSPKYSDNKITVNIFIDYEKLMVEVIDEGRGDLHLTKDEILKNYSITSLVDINKTILEKRGRGLYLMSQLADHLEIKPYLNNQGTTVVFYKYRKNVEKVAI